EGGPAAAAAGRLGIVELETGPSHAEDVIDVRALQIAGADAVDIHGETVLLVDDVVGARLALVVEGILEAAAAAAAHRDAETEGRVDPLLLAGDLHHLDRLGGEGDGNVLRDLVTLGATRDPGLRLFGTLHIAAPCRH